MSDAAQEVPAAIVVVGDDTLAPEWDDRPGPRSRPGRAPMRDDLVAPARTLPARSGARRRGPLGDDLLEPDWAALLPRGLVIRRAIAPLGDDPIAPDWRWRAPADAVLLRRTMVGPLGDDLLHTDWSALCPVLYLGRGPMGDDVLRPDDGAGQRRGPCHAARR